MDALSVDEVRQIRKLLTVPLSEERLLLITPALNETLKALQILASLHLQKNVEPSSYLSILRNVGNEH